MAIWHPKIGQRVRLHYRKALQSFMPYHGCCGIVKIVAKPRRAPKKAVVGVRNQPWIAAPLNVLVELDDGRSVVVPRGNLEVATDGEVV